MPRLYLAGAIAALTLALVTGFYSLVASHTQAKADLEQTESALDDAEAYVETRKELDDATSDLPDEPDAVRDRLRNLAE